MISPIQHPIETSLTSFFIGLVVSGALAFPIFKLLLAIKSRQTVSAYLGETHQAKQGTPTMGGVIILVGATVGMVVCKVDWRQIALFVGFALVGFADDFIVPRMFPGKRGLGWIPKLAMQLALSIGVLMSYGDVGFVGIAIYTFAILFMANAYNFSDGLDGLAGGLLIIFALGVVGVAFFTDRFDPQSLSYATAVIPLGALIGGTIPFLVLNRRPAKVFMGDVGSLPIGALMGMVVAGFVMTLETGTPNIYTPGQMWIGIIGILVLSFVMIAELVPVPLQILSVKLRKGKRLFPRTPIHHAFELYNWPEEKITRLFYAVQAVCSILAVIIFWFVANGGKS